MITETFYGLNRHNPKHLEKLRYVLSLDGAKRWRAAAELYLYLNPKSYTWDEQLDQAVVAMDARTEARIIAEEAAELREGLKAIGNELGLSEDKESGRRYALRMPATMLKFIQLIDPDLLDGTPEERRESLRRLTAEFQEFQVLTRI
jgi:hypothetical protein